MDYLSSLRRMALACSFAASMTAAGTAQAAGYVVTNLVSDGAVAAAHTDLHLKNTWGIAFNPFGFVWVANNHDGTSTLYDGSGTPQSLVVTVPAADGSSLGSPVGITYSGSADFNVSANGLTGPSRFIFASEDGVISGWAPNVDSAHALRAVVTPGAIYKGIAIAANGSGNRLYATDFHNARIDVFDRAFAPVATTGFVDASLPRGFAPFGIRNIDGNLYVTYARQDRAREDDRSGRGLGYVNVFDADGKLLRRVASRTGLNAPWGIAVAPANFGAFSNRLLVANFGDGTVSAYDLQSGAYIGQLTGSDGKPLQIPGLWGIAFGNGLSGQPVNTLFFTAGPFDEADGVYGSIVPKSGY